MMNSVLSFKKPLEELLHRIQQWHEGYCTFTIGLDDELANQISSATWSAMVDFCNFLKPFKQAIVLLSASKYSTMRMAILVFTMIMKHVDQAIKHVDRFRSNHTILFVKEIQSKLQDYESKTRCADVKIACVLDLRVKSFLNQINIFKKEVKDLIMSEYDTYYLGIYNGLVQNLNQEVFSRDVGGYSMNSFLNLLGPAADRSREAALEPFGNKFYRWMNHQEIDIKMGSREVFLWLKCNRTMYLRIAFMARDYMGITATSIFSECAFSMAGNVVSKRRARLGDDAVQAICDLQSFLKFK